MSGERPFDDDRYPDEEGFACCFMCGKKVDPRDRDRVAYQLNAYVNPLPAHGNCIFGANMFIVQTAFLTAYQQMTDANALRAMREAGIVNPRLPWAH